MGGLVARRYVLSPVRSHPLPQSEPHRIRRVVTLGTPWRNPAGEDWAYVFWQAADGSSLSNRTMAVYRKAGEAAGPGVFTRQSVVRRQANPIVITPLLDRSSNVGQDLALLAEQTDGLFQAVIPAPGLPLAEKLSAVIQGLTRDSALMPRAQLGARVHPGLALALGQAWAEPFPVGIDVVTYELRDFNIATDADLSVLARVTLRRGQPLVLPAPGGPVEVPTNGVQKHLLARMRWATPDSLRRLSPAINGYNLYRISRPRAVQLGFLNGTPGNGVLASLSQTDSAVERVNRSPIYPGKEFSITDVGSFALDSTTVFVSDFNRLGQGGPGFKDGEQYCYYVAARDILGRDGAYSAPGCVTICDQVPPAPPHQLRVVNDFVVTGGKGTQRLRPRFEASTSANTNGTLEYRVYRWNSRLEFQKPGALPTLVATIPHRSTTNDFTALDNGPTAPTVDKNAGHVYWYTVRSAQRSACGIIESADSAPAPGILRDRSGPESSEPTLTVRQPDVNVLVRPVSNEGGGLTNLPPGAVRYWLDFRRDSREIAWLDVEMVDPSLPAGSVTPGRHYFPQYQNGTSLPHATAGGFNRFQWGYVSTNKTGLKVRVSTGLANGVTSPKQEYVLPASNPVNSVGLTFDLSVRWTNRTATSGAGHYPRSLVPELADKVTGIPIRVKATPDTQQWRIYRRLDDGDLTMLAEGDVNGPAPVPGRNALPAAPGDIEYTDEAMPINVAQATYFTQFLDRHGNSGRLVASAGIFISTPPPAPTFLTLKAGGETNDPATRMSVIWSGAPYGISRYRIYVGDPSRQAVPLIQVQANLAGLGATARGRAAPAGLSVNTGFTLPFDTAVFRDFETASGTTNLPCTIIDTPRVGGRLGSGPVFTNVIDRPTVESDLYVMIEAVAEDGTVSEVSRTQKLGAGEGARSPLPNAAWPARPLPPVRSVNWVNQGSVEGVSTLGIAAVRLKRGDPEGGGAADFDGLGVRIASGIILPARPGQNLPEGRNAFLGRLIDPDSLLIQEKKTSLPLFGQVASELGGHSRAPAFDVPVTFFFKPARGLVMYRQQVPSEKYPQPAGDLIQVTPLMPGIAYRDYPIGSVVSPKFPAELPTTQIIDPFIGLFKGKDSAYYELYLLDTQPIIQGASYHYFLVRFDEYGEMIETIPTNPVTATREE